MLNILMATNNNNMIKFFINNILVKNDKARLYKITNNIEQTTEVLNNNDIDIIILDLRILQNNITSMFDMIKKERMDKYKKSVENIRTNLKRATDCMYNDCESKRLQKYFGLSDDEKPTVKEVIYTVLDKIQ